MLDGFPSGAGGGLPKNDAGPPRYITGAYGGLVLGLMSAPKRLRMKNGKEPLRSTPAEVVNTKRLTLRGVAAIRF